MADARGADDVGALVLVATPIGNLGDLTPRAVDALSSADVIAAEDTRRTRALLSHAGIEAGDRLVAVHEHNEAARADTIVDEIGRGRRVAYVTDAGMPAISDPGARLVEACARAGLRVEVVPGPSSVSAALAVSGLPADRYVFEGFLPRKGPERRSRIDALVREERTAVIFESPARLSATLTELADALGGERQVAIARELTKVHEEVWRGTLGECAEGAPVTERGEVVVVVGPSPGPPPASEADVERALRSELDRGASARDAAATVAEMLGVSKRQAYELANRFKR